MGERDAPLVGAHRPAARRPCLRHRRGRGRVRGSVRPGARRRLAHPHARGSPRRAPLPRGLRPRRRRPHRPGPRRLAHRCHHRRPRPRPTHSLHPHRRLVPGRARGQRGSAPRPRPRHHHDRAGRRRIRGASPETRDPHRRRPHRARRRHDTRHAAHALTQTQGRRPADPAPGGLHRPRPAWHWPLRRTGLTHHRARRGCFHPRLPRHRIRSLQTRPTRRPALRAHRRTRPDLEVHGVRRTLPDEDGRRRLGQNQGTREEGRERGR